MTTSRTQAIAAALARVPRSGSPHADVCSESAVVIKKLRPLLVGFKLGSVLRARYVLGAGYSCQLLRAEAAGCDCTHDVSQGMFRCTSSRQHAVTEIVIEERSSHANNDSKNCRRGEDRGEPSFCPILRSRLLGESSSPRCGARDSIALDDPELIAMYLRHEEQGRDHAAKRRAEREACE